MEFEDDQDALELGELFDANCAALRASPSRSGAGESDGIILSPVELLCDGEFKIIASFPVGPKRAVPPASGQASARTANHQGCPDRGTLSHSFQAVICQLAKAHVYLFSTCRKEVVAPLSNRIIRFARQLQAYSQDEASLRERFGVPQGLIQPRGLKLTPFSDVDGRTIFQIGPTDGQAAKAVTGGEAPLQEEQQDRQDA